MTTIPEQDMRTLLDDASAEPLLPDTFPVPARYDGRWWHQPTRPAADKGTDGVPFVAVPVDQAARYDDLLRRRRQAHAEPIGQPPDE